MPAETVTYIADLDVAAPSGAAPKSEGDDHIRNGKKAAKNTFPGFTGAVLVGGVDGGAANVYTLAPATPLVGYTAKMQVVFQAIATNTTTATLNVSGLGAKALVSESGAALGPGDLTAGRYYTAVYDGTKFRLTSVPQNYIDQLVIAGTVPGVSNSANAGKVFASTGAVGTWISLDGRGDPVFNNGDIATGTLVIDYAKGDGQKARATGQHTLTATGFPTGRLAGVLLELTNYGAFALTTTGILWIKSDGTETANFSQSGITFPSAGRGRAVLYSYGDGIIFGKAA
jgi:hypothetical protein